MDTVIAKIVPIFILAFIGFFAGKLRLLPENTGSILCAFLFYFCAPAVSFSNIISSDIHDIFNLRFALAVILFEASVFLLLYIIYRTVFGMRKTALIVRCICSFYGNISYVGIPVFLAIFNNVIPNLITLLIHMLLTFPFVIFLLDLSSETGSGTNTFRTVLKSFKNPNIFFPVIGAVLLYFHVEIPQVIRDSVELMGKPTTTVGMFALGMTCAQAESGKFSLKVLAEAMLSAVFKLVLCPLVAYAIGRFLFSLDGWWLNSLVIMAMLPAALNDFILSKRYHSEENFASFSVLLSTLFFSITISLYLMIIKL